MSLGQKLYCFLIRAGLFPNVFLLALPLKIYEFKELEKDIDYLKDEQILDVGCGVGIQTLCLGKRCKHIVGIDIKKGVVEYAQYLSSKLQGKISSQFICCSLQEAAFPEDFFDKIFSICVIEHIPDYEKVIAEINRILKPSGVFAFSVDALNSIVSLELMNKHKKEHSVHKYFSTNELFLLLARNGFRDIKVYPILKSDFAKKLFIKGIRNGFKFRASYIVDYLRLVLSEKRTKNREGLFLVAKCRK